ncbi:MAG: sulfatase/phosphatase domain-containing protein [Cellulosilyticaceae bacterium]
MQCPLSEGKGWMYDGGVREPLIAYWKGTIGSDSLSHRLVTSPDFYPTFLEIAGAPLQPQQHQDGESFANTLRGAAGERQQPLFWHYPHYGNQGGTPYSAIRDGAYKLIYFYEDESVALYDLTQDVGETHNLADQMPEVVEALLVTLKKWVVEVDGRIPVTNPAYTDRDHL